MGPSTRWWVARAVEKYRLAGPVLETGVGWTPEIMRSLFPADVAYTTQDITAYPTYCPDVVCDITSLEPVESGSMATVICCSVLEHVYAPWRAAEALTRVLAPGGRLVLTVPYRVGIHRHTRDYWGFKPDGVNELFRGLRLLEMGIEGNIQLPAGVFAVFERDDSQVDWLAENERAAARPVHILGSDYLTPKRWKKRVVDLARRFGYDLGLWGQSTNREGMLSWGYAGFSEVVDIEHVYRDPEYTAAAGGGH